MESIEYVIIKKKNKPKLMETKKVKHKINHGNDEKHIIELLTKTYKLKNLTEEYAYILGFQGKKLAGIFQLSHGTVKKCDMEMKTIYKFLFLLGADGFVICHNHPNERCEMSQDDYNRTTELVAISNLFSISFYSHIIIGNDGWRNAKDDLCQMHLRNIDNVNEYYRKEKISCKED